jgi:hypothetical protein
MKPLLLKNNNSYKFMDDYHNTDNQAFIYEPLIIIQSMTREKYLSSINTLNKIYDIQPQDETIIYNLAILNYESQEYQVAYELFNLIDITSTSNALDVDKYNVLYYSALCMMHLEYKWNDVHAKLIEAHEIDPERLEALYQISYYFAKNNKINISYKYIKDYEFGKKPIRFSLMERGIYDIKIYALIAELGIKVNDIVNGKKACERLLILTPSDTVIDQLQKYIQLELSNK